MNSEKQPNNIKRTKRTSLTILVVIATLTVIAICFIAQLAIIADGGDLQISQSIGTQCVEKEQTADITVTITNAPKTITSIAIQIVFDQEVINITQGQITAENPFINAFTPGETLQGVAAWLSPTDLNNTQVCIYTIKSLKAAEATTIKSIVSVDFSDGTRQSAEYALTIATCSHTNRNITNNTATHHTSDCADCTFTEQIAHTFDKQIIDPQYIKQEADCITPDTYYMSCQCGASSQNDNHIFTDGEALGHHCDDYIYNNDATCTLNGTETGNCIRCQTPMTREAADTALGHDHNAVITPPTRDDQGYTTHTCIRCTDSYVDTYVPAIGYDFGDMNKDGFVTAEDAVLLHNHINDSSNYPLADDRDTDINNDGITNKADVEYLMKYLVYPDRYPLVKEGALIPVKPETSNIASDRAIVITASKGEVTQGQQVTFTVNISGENPIDLMGLLITYDSNVFEVVSAEATNPLANGVWSYDAAANLFVATNTQETLSGQILIITLKVKDGIEEGEYHISITPVIKNDNNILDTAVTPASINVIDVVRGDVNGTNTVTSDDAVYLLRHIFMPSFYKINQSGDMNGDGNVTSDDAVYLLRHIFMPNFYPLA